MRALLVPLLFIHGVKGGILSDDQGVRWLNAWQAIGLSAPELKLPAMWKGPQSTDGLKPTGILEKVLFTDVYGKWMQTARGMKRPSFHAFAYDWRRENAEAVDLLEKELVKIGKPVQVVAHSMGGLITMALMNRRPELFQSVVFAGVPFTGGIGFLPDLQDGVATGFNSRILSPYVLATFPSVYTFFANTPDILVGERPDFFDAEEWKRLKIGMYKAGRTAPDGFDLFLAEALRRAKLFRAQIYSKNTIKYPPIAVLCGKAHPTLKQARRKGDDWDFDSEPKVPGDGRVQRTHCLPPEGIQYDLREVDLEHAELLNDPELPKILDALAGRNA